MWTDPGIKSGISVRGLIDLHFKKQKQKKAQTGSEWVVQFSPKILASEEKATTKFVYRCTGFSLDALVNHSVSVSM